MEHEYDTIISFWANQLYHDLKTAHHIILSMSSIKEQFKSWITKTFPEFTQHDDDNGLFIIPLLLLLL
jgi:hypothetical protein